jgi:hypothetical protein
MEEKDVVFLLMAARARDFGAIRKRCGKQTDPSASMAANVGIWNLKLFRTSTFTN